MSAQPSVAEWLVDLLREGVFLALWLAAPVVLAALVAGFLVSVVQAATQVSEPTLGLLPKLLAAAAALAIAGPWMGRELFDFAVVLLELIPRIGHA